MLLWRVWGLFVSLFNLLGNLTELSSCKMVTSLVDCSWNFCSVPFGPCWQLGFYSTPTHLLRRWQYFSGRVSTQNLEFQSFLLQFPPAIVTLKSIPSFFKPLWLQVSIHVLAIQHGRTGAGPEAKLGKTEKEIHPLPFSSPKCQKPPPPPTLKFVCFWVTLLLKTIF